MRKQIVCLMVCTAFAISARGETLFGQTVIKAPAPVGQDVKTLKAAALRTYNPSLFPQTIDMTQGLAKTYPNKQTGEIWIVGMYGSSIGATYMLCGFLSSSIKNTGTTDWTGVTITATVQVLKCQGGLSLNVTRQEGGSYYGSVFTSFNTPGTYVCTLGPFNMKPNIDYCGRACITHDELAAPVLNEPISCYAKITSIKFNLP